MKAIIKKPMALIGFICIVVSILLATFAYFLIEDTSPNANDQYPEIALKKMGFKTKALLLKNDQYKKRSFFSQLISGQEKPYRLLPINQAEKSESGITVVSHYQQEQFISEHLLYHPLKEPLATHLTTKQFLFGTDRYGRSVLSRLILGIRVSLLVGFTAVLISLLVGIGIGAFGGYFGGWIDQIVLYLINVTWSIPTLLLVFAIVLAFGRGLSVIFIAVGLTMWVDVARIVRGQVKKVKEEAFVTAAKSIGAKESYILMRHVLPNIIGPILVIAAANFATAILIEAGLSYLGFGIKPPTPSIGNMLNDHYGFAVSGKLYLAMIPSITIMVLVLSFNLLGSGLRDIFDVKNR